MKLSELFGGDAGVPADQFPDPAIDVPPDPTGTPQSVVLGGGCFWCTEAVFVKLDGVIGVVSGYAGGTADTADYKTVCSGTTDHAEVIRVRFDSSVISFGQILKVFFAVAHDPTHLNRQGNDIGRQYRSAIFYANDDQRRVADRDDARAARPVLRGRGLPSEFRGPQSRAALRGRRRGSEGQEAGKGLR